MSSSAFKPVNPAPRPPITRLQAQPAVRAAVLPADRSFKVLQPSRTPAQLSLFPPPGLLAQRGR